MTDSSQQSQRTRNASDGGSQESQSVPHQEYEAYAIDHDDPGGEGPDVLLDVPVVKVDEINLEVQDLRARVSLRAEVLELLKLNVGADVTLDRVHLHIKGVEAQALLKVRLDNVSKIVDRVLTTIDRNPQLLENLTENLGQAVGEVGEGAGQAAGDLGQSAGQAVEGVGEGAGQAAQGASQAAQGATQGATQAATQAAGDASRAAGQAAGAAGGSSTESSQARSGNPGADITVEQEFIDENGNIVSRGQDKSGKPVEQLLDDEGRTLDTRPLDEGGRR